MRLKITLTLLAILTGLLGYIFFLEPWQGTEGDDAEASNVLGRLAADLDAIRIAKASNQSEIVLRKIENRWSIAKPYNWPANPYAIERLLTQLRFADKEVSFQTSTLKETGSSLSEYGLEPPEMTVEFGKGEQLYRIGIGKATATGNNLYILSVDREYIHVVNRNLFDSLSIELDKLRSENVFESGIYEVKSWNVQIRNASRVRLVRSGDTWAFETPIRARADAAAVNTTLSRVLELKAASILTADALDLSAYGLQNPELRIVLESDQRRENLEIGNPVDPANPTLRFAKREDRASVFTVDLAFQDLLATAQTSLRDRRILSLDAKRSTSVVIQRNGTSPLTLHRLENGDWELVIRETAQGIETYSADKLAVEELLSWLDALKAVPQGGFVNDAPTAQNLETYGLETSQMSITITSPYARDKQSPAASPIVESMVIGDRTGPLNAERFIKLKSREFVYSVYNDALERARSLPTDLLDRSIYRQPAGSRVTQLRITRHADGAELLSATGSQLAEPGIAALLTQLANLRSGPYLPGGYADTVTLAGQESPWAYTLNLVVESSTPQGVDPADFELSVSSLTGGPLLLGGSKAKNQIFRFEQTFIDAFSPIVFERAKKALPDEPFAPAPDAN